MSEEFNPNAFEDGMSAYHAGDFSAARRHLTQAVRNDRTNATAWLYLSKVQTDPEKARKCLERVLELEPDNEEARAALSNHTTDRRAADNLDDVRQAIPVGGSATGGVPLPSGIPGAPDAISPQYVAGFFSDRLSDGVNLLTGKTKQIDAGAASWWQVIFMGALASFITGLAVVLGLMILNFRLVNLLSVLTTPLITTLTGTVALLAGAFLSHWYLTTQRGGNAPLVQHAYVMALVWFPLALVNAALVLVSLAAGSRMLSLQSALAGNFSVGGLGLILTLIGGALVGAALVFLRQHLRPLYNGVPDSALLIAGGGMLAVTALLF